MLQLAEKYKRENLANPLYLGTKKGRESYRLEK